MNNEKRLCAYIRKRLAEIEVLGEYERLKALMSLDFELATLIKLLDMLPSYARDYAFDAICGKEEANA